jgi:hypothetical protein
LFCAFVGLAQCFYILECWGIMSLTWTEAK